MNVPPLDLFWQHEPLLPQMLEAFQSIVKSGRFVLGQAVEEFESALARYCGAAGAVGVSSGTDALLVALMALQIGPGDEVITTPFTFFATAGSIARLGAVPVFVDIDADTFNIDPARIEQAIADRTKAIVPVHLYGLMADMDPIMQIARRHDLKVIEDVAQAIGAQREGATAGVVGDVGCFSFYPTKSLSALGDAGACVTTGASLADRIRALRVHGDTSRYCHEYIGGNFRIDALQAAMLSIKFPHLDDWNEARRRIADRYDALLDSLPIVTPYQPPQSRHVFCLYTIRVPDGRRDALAAHLASNGIGYGIHYAVPLHLQACFAYLGGKAGDFPIAEQAAGEILCLPMFPGLTEQQQDEVVRTVGEFFG